MKYKRIIKNCILDELTNGQYCLFNKETKLARYNGTDLTMVMDSVVAGILKANEVIEKDFNTLNKGIDELIKKYEDLVKLFDGDSYIQTIPIEMLEDLEKLKGE